MKRLVMAVMMAAAWQCLASAAAPDTSKVRIGNAMVQRSVATAVDTARGQLANPECQKVLTDFRAVDGRTLVEHLDDLRLTAKDYVGFLWFIDGDKTELCRSTVFAFTQPGSRAIYVCGSSFMGLVGRAGPISPSVVVIHEMLHSLGLGEGGSFPSSAAITHRVELRCGR